VNRDNVLYVLFGLLIGFLSGYILHEVMSTRQPPLMPFGQAAQAGMPAPEAPTASGTAQGSAANPSGQDTETMQQILQLRDYVAQHPDDADAVLTLGNMNFEIQRWNSAAKHYEQYLQSKPNNPDVITDLGVCNRELGNYDKALTLFHRAQKLSPDHWQSRYNEVVVLAFDLGRPGDALPVLKDLERLQPDNQQVQQLAAEVLRRDQGTAAGAAS
jgi:tetratricopeptide (TPR) repeat protein